MLSGQLGTAAVSVGRRMCWAFAREADSDFGSGLDPDSGSGSGSGSADSCCEDDCCGHATGSVDWPLDALPGLGLGSCGS